MEGYRSVEASPPLPEDGDPRRREELLNEICGERGQMIALRRDLCGLPDGHVDRPCLARLHDRSERRLDALRALAPPGFDDG